MRYLKASLSLVLFLTVSCNFPRGQQDARQTTASSPVATIATNTPSLQPPTPRVTEKPNPKATVNWSGKTFTVETNNLIIYYPDFVDPGEARKHADALQKSYNAFQEIFAFGDEPLYAGQKTVVEWNPLLSTSSASHNHIYMGLVSFNLLASGDLNPPEETFIHEMGHVFENAQLDAGRYYIFTVVVGIEEAFAEYMECQPIIFSFWDRGARSKAYCDLLQYDIGDKVPETALTYYETKKVDPYGLDWGSHPPGASGEVYFRQMLARISDKAGWGIWEKYFSATKDSGGSPAAKEVSLNESLMKKGADMRDPSVKKAFSEFVTDLGKSIGQDLRPMFRGWGFEL